MAQHLLDGAQIRPVLQQMGGKGVAQGMGRDVLFDPRLFLIVLNELPKALALMRSPLMLTKRLSRWGTPPAGGAPGADIRSKPAPPFDIGG